jgi:hypothetical protein
MESHAAGGPGETGPGPDGAAPPWPPMPPCHRCGAAFAAHLDGRCPETGTATQQTGTATQPVTAQQWAAGIQGSGQPSASWVPPPGGPHPTPAPGGPRPSWRSWPRRHRLLTGAIMLIVLLISAGIVRAVSLAMSQPAQANGNATACTDFWRMAGAGGMYDGGGLLAGWQDLQAAAPGITSPALSTPVGAFVADLRSGDTVDAGTESFAIATACTALGYGNPG